METNNNDPSTQMLLITENLDAPLPLVFETWTQAKHLEKWWGPKGLSIKVSKLNVEPGGEFLYGMVSDAFVMWGKFVYLQIESPNKIVFLNSFSDEDGGITRAPFSATWPLEVKSTITLTEESGLTKLTFESVPHNASEEEITTFRDGIPSMTAGFGGTFDQLAQYLSTLQS